MKITLKQDWDISSQPPNRNGRHNIGHFVGRKKELSLLQNELSRKSQGAILISGYRGVGKTAFVYKALQNIYQEQDGKIYLVVLMNSNSLGSTGTSNIMLNLIRRLYTATLDEDLSISLRNEIETLYKKAVSVEYRQVEMAEKSHQYSRDVESIVDLTTKAESIEFYKLIWFISFFIATILQLRPITGFADWINKLLPLVFALPVPLVTSLALQYRKTIKNSDRDSNSAQKLYTIDNNLSNLEFDLDRIHQHLCREGIKTIYVLDELDKLEVPRVKEILGYFKNLFTLSSAIFVFIGSEELTDLGRPKKTKEWYRPLEYTFFTSKYYLSRPSSDELLDFVDEIIDSVSEIQNLEDIAFLKRSWIMDANCDYFDLIQTIRGNITGVKGAHPVIDRTVDNSIIRKAKLQQITSLLYSQKYFASRLLKWEQNEMTLRGLYGVSNQILLKNPGGEIQGYDLSEDDFTTMAKNDLLRLLTSLGILNYRGLMPDRSGYPDGVTTHKEYILTDLMPTVIPEKLDFFSQPDENLLTRINNLYLTLVNLWNIDAVLHEFPMISLAKFQDNPLYFINKIADRGFNVKYAIDQIQPAYLKIINSQVTLTLDEIDKYLEIVTTTTNQVNEQAHRILANIIKSALPYEERPRKNEDSSVVEPSNLRNYNVSKSEESGYPIIELCLTGEENKWVMVCNGGKQYEGQIQGQAYNERVIIINSESQGISIDGSVSLIALQREYSQSSINDFVKFILLSAIKRTRR